MRYFFLLLFLGAVCSIHGQALQTKISRSIDNESLTKVFERLEKEQPIRFFYLSTWLDKISIPPHDNEVSLKDILDDVLTGTDIHYVQWYNYAIIFYKDPSLDIRRDALIESARKDNTKIKEVLIGNVNEYKPGAKVRLHGIITDVQSKVPIEGVSVYINGLEIGSATNATGEYEFVLPAGEYLINYSFVNYEDQLINVKIYSSGTVNITLSEKPVTLQEVIVSDQRIANNRVGQVMLKMTDLKRTPSFLGLPDIIRQVQSQPGVSTVSEASSGFNVRGGGVDQNLVLFDGVPIFNTSHALGFFTIFNAEAISQTSFYKGGIPAEFGGRVSSVLNITAKEGGYEKWSGSGGIGVVSSDFAVGGPIKKDTSSLVVSFRSSYSDWILNLLKTKYQDIQKGSIYFYDGSIKYSHKLNKLSKIVFSGYTSNDRFKLASDTTNQWQNIALSVKYEHTAKKNISYSTGFYFGKYSYHLYKDSPQIKAFNLRYGVIYPSIKLDFNHEGLFHRQTFGFQATYYSFSPGELKPTSAESNISNIKMPTEKSIESAIYLSDSFHATDRLNVDVGMRISIYNRFGPGLQYQYTGDKPLTPENTVNSREFKSGEIMKIYLGPEPRLSLRYMLGTESSLKLGYNRIYQYVHLISNSASITPVDIWQSSNTYFRPQRADQVSFGYFKNSKDNNYEFYVDSFYKQIENILDFKDGASLILNPQLETALLKGIGRSYGVEFSINKIKGRLTGGVNYTYSRSLRKINGEFDIEKINKGDWYPSNYDIPHIVNLSWRYAMTSKVFFTGTFAYHTGRPVSLPLSGYIIDNVPVTDFSERNNYRIPDYHRLDVALVIEGGHRKKKFFEGSWVISFYNVYGRRNPYSLFFVNKGGGVLKPYQLSLIGTIVPSIMYRLKF